MSWKIYEAYRTRDKGITIWGMLPALVDSGQRRVKAILKQTCVAIASTVLTDSEQYKKESATWGEAGGRIMMAGHLMYDGYKISQGMMEKNPFDYDCRINVWELDGRLYLIPYCGNGVLGALSWLKRRRELEFYGYWNNTDKPNNISRERWKERRDVWETLVKHWDRHVVVEIMTWSRYGACEPAMSMAFKLARRDRRGKST
jgi:hypothetical protein